MSPSTMPSEAYSLTREERTLVSPMSHLQHYAHPAAQAKSRLPQFRKASNGFVPSTHPVAEEVFLTVSAAGRVYDTPERNSDLEDAATHHMATHSTSLGISFAGSGLIVEGGQTPDNEDVSVGSPDTDSSDSFLGSNGSFERWARGDGQAHDNGNADTITTTHPLAERSSQTEESAHRETSVVYEAPRQLILPPPGTALSEIDAFAATWAENVAIQQSTLDPDCPRSPNQHPATQGQPSPRPGKYSYTSPEAASRLTYIRSYLSLPKDKASADVLLALLHRYRRAAYQAARRNGAFLRAAQDIDWTGILEELPPSRADNRLLHDRQLIKTWLEAKRGLVFSQTDDDGDTVYLLEDEDDKKLSFEELLAMEGLHGGDWEIQDDEVYDRVRDLGPVKPQRRRIQEKPDRRTTDSKYEGRKGHLQLVKQGSPSPVSGTSHY